MIDLASFFLTNFIFLIILFFIFLSLALTISQRNPINAILYLITFFFSVAFLFIYCGADYLGILFLMLYAGAISIILLFVVMFLDLKDIVIQRESYSKVAFYFILFVFMFVFLRFIYLFYLDYTTFLPVCEPLQNWVKAIHFKTNIEVIGISFFEYFLFQFLALGVLLFLVMVLVIVLVINSNSLSKKQLVDMQNNSSNLLRWSS